MLKVKLFGIGEVCYLNKKITIPLHQLPGQLFCYLLLNRGHPQNRELLAETFWAGRASTESKKYLRKSLWQLRHALGDLTGRCADKVLVVDAEWLQVNPQADLWIDVAEFEQRYQSVMNVRGYGLDSNQYANTQKAIKLYQGDLLEGWYHDWCLLERERYKEMYLSLIDKLMGYYEANNQYEAGIFYGRKILKYDKTHERTHLRLMRLNYLSGDRISAIRQYAHCCTALHEELDVEPGAEIQELYEEIIRGGVETPRFHGGFVHEKGFAESSKIHDSLEQILKMLSNQDKLRVEILKEINSIEAVVEKRH